MTVYFVSTGVGWTKQTPLDKIAVFAVKRSSHFAELIEMSNNGVPNSRYAYRNKTYIYLDEFFVDVFEKHTP